MKRKVFLLFIVINNFIVVNLYYYFEFIGYIFKDMFWGWFLNRKLVVKNEDWEGRDYLFFDGGIYYLFYEDKDLIIMFFAIFNFIVIMGYFYVANFWIDF